MARLIRRLSSMDLILSRCLALNNLAPHASVADHAYPRYSRKISQVYIMFNPHRKQGLSKNANNCSLAIPMPLASLLAKLC